MTPFERRWDAPEQAMVAEVVDLYRDGYVIRSENSGGVHNIHRMLVFNEAKWPSVGDIVQLEYRRTSSGAYWYITQILS